VPAWRKLLAQFADPLIYLLLGAIAISVAAWALQRMAPPAATVLRDGAQARIPAEELVSGDLVLAEGSRCCSSL
jgi:Ca2+-transporting ATPase